MRNPTRYLGVYAVAVRDGAVLVTKKGRGPFTGRWDLPGGGMEFGETPEATLRRELVEETGLAPTAYMLRDVWANLIVDTRPEHLGEQTHHVGVIYTVTLEDRAPKSGPDGEDSLEARWVKVAELEERNCTPFLWRAVGMGAGEG